MQNKRLIIKNIILTFIAAVLGFSVYVSAFATVDGEIDDKNSTQYSLNVYVPKNTAGSISFYPTVGFDEDNRDVFNEEDIISYTEDFSADERYDIYTLSCQEGTYSFRATDNDGKSLGGGVIKVPADISVENEGEESREITAYLRLSKTYITNKYEGKKASSEDFSVTLVNKHGTVTMGDAFIDEKGNSCYPALIYANGNALLYYVTATPSEEYADLHSLKEERNSNIAVFKNDKIQSFRLELPEEIPFKINAPTGAKVFMYDQILNFNTIKILPVNIKDNGDGTSDFEFAGAGGSWRVSMEGERTQAGYILNGLNEDENFLKISFPDGEVKEQEDAWVGRKESGVLLNINERNKLSLEIGESYKVRAYRAPWQIINSDTDNVMIEPDFHFNILLGEDVIDIKQSDGGNAGGNWAEITARGEGVAIVEVSYDAIDVSWNNKTEFYGATNPGRTGVFVVTVGDGFGDVLGIDIDAEFYTDYFIGERGTLEIFPEGENVSVEVANIWQGDLQEWENIEAVDGIFKVPLSTGNNILKITADGVCDYRVVRASRLETVITNKTNSERTEKVFPGDELTIGFKGLFQWIPKFSGIYNPSSLYFSYKQGEKAVESTKSQYNLPEATMDITVPADAKDSIVLTSGKLTGNTLGSLWSAHRQLTDIGVPANFNASTILLEDLALPDLIIPIAENSDNNGTDEPEDSENNNGDEPSGGGGFYEPESDGIDVSDLKFDISESEISGYVTVSFTDNGKRKSDEGGVTYKTPLGEIIEAVKVPFKDEDTVVSVTLRLLKALNIKASYTGKATNNFYLSSIGNFTLNGKFYSSFGEFDAGAASGWMVKHNNWFINMGASEFLVEDGDKVEWLYTCRLGSDIGCDWSNQSADISGIKFKKNYGTLSPAFDKDTKEYTYTVSSATDFIALEAEKENYWSKTVYESEGKTYKAMEDIPVSDGTVIMIESSFSEYMGYTPTDTDSVKITVEKRGGSSGGSYIDETDTEEIKKDELINDDKISEKELSCKIIFPDVKKSDWYYDCVEYVYKNELMQGTGNGFEPESKMSRAMFVTVLYRMEKPEEKSYKQIFTDVSESEWYYNSVAWAAENGIVNGVSETEFKPCDYITREQMALIIYRYAMLKGADITELANLEEFTDADEVSHWAYDAIKWANKAGIINGTDENTLSPKATATRAQAAAILMRFCLNLVK